MLKLTKVLSNWFLPVLGSYILRSVFCSCSGEPKLVLGGKRDLGFLPVFEITPTFDLEEEEWPVAFLSFTTLAQNGGSACQFSRRLHAFCKELNYV